MSWSVSAIGKAKAVKVEINRQFSVSSPCLEPEESVRLAAASVIDVALTAFGDDIAVKISASGHQGYKDWNNKTGVHNNLNIAIEPIHGFVE